MYILLYILLYIRLMKKATVTIILDTHKGLPKKNGLYGVKIRVTYNRLQKYFNCNCDMSEERFEKVMYSKKLTAPEQEAYDRIIKEKVRINEVIDNMETFSWELLLEQLNGKSFNDKITGTPVYDLFDRLIKECESEDRVGNADFLKCAKNSLCKFKSNLQFRDITPKFLESYERWFLSQGYSITTVGIYLRELRNIYNTATTKEFNLAPKESYPFHNKENPKGYLIPLGNNIKKALSKEQIELVKTYPFKIGSVEDKARDFWYFTYLNNGINHKDICQLKYKDIVRKEIHFKRAKTSRSNRGKDKTIIASILQDSQRIIEKWGNPDKDPDNYVFPVLTKGLSARRIREVHCSHLQTINKFNNRLAKKLKLEMRLTTMVARHSFASVMIENGVDLAIIKELMGHSSITTTEIYVKPFNSGSRRKTAELLINPHKQENPSQTSIEFI
jgi:integrase/recombinase XerD